MLNGAITFCYKQRLSVEVLRDKEDELLRLQDYNTTWLTVTL
jgi:hypothetical protein